MCNSWYEKKGEKLEYYENTNWSGFQILIKYLSLFKVMYIKMP